MGEHLTQRRGAHSYRDFGGDSGTVDVDVA